MSITEIKISSEFFFVTVTLANIVSYFLSIPTCFVIGVCIFVIGVCIFVCMFFVICVCIFVCMLFVIGV